MIFFACVQDCHLGWYFLLLNVAFENETTLLKVMRYSIAVWNLLFFFKSYCYCTKQTIRNSTISGFNNMHLFLLIFVLTCKSTTIVFRFRRPMSRTQNALSKQIFNICSSYYCIATKLPFFKLHFSGMWIRIKTILLIQHKKIQKISSKECVIRRHFGFRDLSRLHTEEISKTHCT